MYEIHLLLLTLNTFLVLFIFTDNIPMKHILRVDLLDRLVDYYPRFTISSSLSWFYFVGYFILNTKFFIELFSFRIVIFLYTAFILFSFFMFAVMFVSFCNICWRHNLNE